MPDRDNTPGANQDPDQTPIDWIKHENGFGHSATGWCDQCPDATISCDRCGKPVAESDIHTNAQDKTICQTCATPRTWAFLQNADDQDERIVLVVAQTEDEAIDRYADALFAKYGLGLAAGDPTEYRALVRADIDDANIAIYQTETIPRPPEPTAANPETTLRTLVLAWIHWTASEADEEDKRPDDLNANLAEQIRTWAKQPELELTDEEWRRAYEVVAGWNCDNTDWLRMLLEIAGPNWMRGVVEEADAGEDEDPMTMKPQPKRS